MNLKKSKFESVIQRCILAPLCLAVLGVGFVTGAVAATKAGTIIKNQASASYKDTQGIRRVATSNVVETLIRQVAGFEFTQDQTKPAVAGLPVYFPHTIVNTGNGPDRFTLTANANGVGAFNLTNIAIYPDDDRDGQPDILLGINNTHFLGAGESQSIVVGGSIPATALDGDTASMIIMAQSEFDTSITISNTDTAVVTDSAVISVNKLLSPLQGSSPGGPFTVRIHYKNSGSIDATDVTLIDALPQGMSYVAGSGRWSVTNATVLTDANPGDDQGGIIYCAYDNSCTGLTEANADADSLSTNQVTAIVATVGAGQTGDLEFDVLIDGGLASSILYNTAEFEYTTDGLLIGLEDSNTVPFRVMSGAAVVINGDSASSADGTGEPLEISDTVSGANSNFPECVLANSDPDGDGYGVEASVECIMPNNQPGSSVFFRNTVWNVGNSIDTFDIATAGSTFPSGSLFRLLQIDGQTPLLDTSGNGVVDTGPIAPGGSHDIVLQVVLPVGVTGNNSGANFEVNTVATSTGDAVATNAMLNRLLNISGGAVDITNIAALGDPAAVGAGVGPEALPVSSVNVTPGETAVIDLYINNTSGIPMDYDLSASIHSDFSSIELPNEWQLEFTLPDNSLVTNTGVIAPGDSALVIAKITVPVNLIAMSQSLYFKAQNDAHAVSDIKHDEIVVDELLSVILGINQNGQTQAGGTHVYTHLLENSGTVDVNNISLSVTDSRAAEGWNSLIYEDTDSDGYFSASDQLVNITNLIAGEKKTLFVKVFVPGSAGDGQSNFSEVVAAWAGGSLTVTDITTASVGEISMTKEQAQDNGCDGSLESAFTNQPFSVEPGNNCVRYRLTAVNASAQAVLNVLVADATPNFTSYVGSASCSQPTCTITEPVAGGQGEIRASLPQLLAGDSIVVEFLVKVD